MSSPTLIMTVSWTLLEVTSNSEMEMALSRRRNQYLVLAIARPSRISMEMEILDVAASFENGVLTYISATVMGPSSLPSTGGHHPWMADLLAETSMATANQIC